VPGSRGCRLPFAFLELRPGATNGDLAAVQAGMVTAVAADDREHAGVAAFWLPSMMRIRLALDLTTSDGVAAQGCAAIARLARLVLLDLTGLSFRDARGLSAFVKIAYQADAAGCGFGLIAPRPPVAKILRVSGLDSRIPVFATTDDALALLTAAATV
jgi:anti-anti-sigma factor